MLKSLQRIFFLLAVTVLLVIAAGCSGEGQSSSALESVGTSSAGANGALLFFLDPNGRPCQMQSSILNNARAKIEEHVTIRYVQSTRKEDHEVFYRYGVRALPSIIVVDANGNEIQRFPPGVQGAEHILTVLRTL